MTHSIEPRTRKYVKGYGVLSLGRNLSNKYRGQLLNAVTKTRLDALKTATNEVAHKAAETTKEFIGNKIANKIVEPKSMSEEIIIPLKQREQIKIIIIKWNTIKYLSYLKIQLHQSL